MGGWAAPLNRADWVVDVMPYETRGPLVPTGFGPGPERFSGATWIQRDICDRKPYPFEDDFFDFAVCTFTLEDVRDPLWVCSELSRIARAGLVEVPSILDELTWRVPEPSGGPWLGHEHHRWICSLEQGELVFLSKFHSLHSRWRLRSRRLGKRELSTEERVLSHFWDGELRARERLVIDEYPYEELERAVLERFRPSRGKLGARELAERLRHAARRGVAWSRARRG